MNKESQIKLYITLDKDRMPEKIEWEADDAGFEGKKESQTMMLSLWDKKEKITYSIDLWTKDMIVEDMQIHFHQVLLKFADTFERSTKNQKASLLIKKFCSEFASELKLESGK